MFNIFGGSATQRSSGILPEEVSFNIPSNIEIADDVLTEVDPDLLVCNSFYLQRHYTCWNAISLQDELKALQSQVGAGGVDLTEEDLSNTELLVSLFLTCISAIYL